MHIVEHACMLQFHDHSILNDNIGRIVTDNHAIISNFNRMLLPNDKACLP